MNHGVFGEPPRNLEPIVLREGPLVSSELSASKSADSFASGAVPDLPKTLSSLQVLRAWAALAVVIVHVAAAMFGRYGEYHLPGIAGAGLIGVDVFFCLSGFIMYYTSWTQFGRRGWWRTFLGRRFLRIYPIYWIVAIATLLVSLWPPSHINAHDTYSLGYLVKSFLLLPQERSPLVTQAWTLVHEVRFYAVFGLLLMGSRRIALGALTAWAAVSLGVLIVSYFNQPLLDSGFFARGFTFLFHPHCIQFVLGVWAAFATCHCRTPKWLDSVLLPAGIVSIAAAMHCFAVVPAPTKYFAITLFTLPSLFMVAGSSLAERRWRPRLPKLLVALGDASYSTYLIHNLIAIPVIWTLFPATENSIVLTVWACALVVAIHGGGWVLHQLVEAPLHRMASGKGPRPAGEPIPRA